MCAAAARHAPLVFRYMLEIVELELAEGERILVEALPEEQQLEVWADRMLSASSVDELFAE